MRKMRCPNPDPNADHRGRGYYYGAPDMVRIYIRISETHPEDRDKPHYTRRTKRTWKPVGQMCPGCGWVVIDETSEEKIEEVSA